MTTVCLIHVICTRTCTCMIIKGSYFYGLYSCVFLVLKSVLYRTHTCTHSRTNDLNVSQCVRQGSQKSWKNSRNWSRREGKDRNIRSGLCWLVVMVLLYMYICCVLHHLLYLCTCKCTLYVSVCAHGLHCGFCSFITPQHACAQWG